MSLTQVDIDDETLAEAMNLMGTKTKKETVNRALEEYVLRLKRIKASEELAEMGARGDFDTAEQAHWAAKKAWKAAFEEPEPGIEQTA
ncbi:type II toxin-antitoxin system VapB family antitoxin [Glycomyces sp. A-F 0318]|uniref:type II toxin-antitoxin system VapB family antitoxin n=1 Tax=Glycomyces amatae TaxID=2881355 RepID=UPI001E2D9928|nr:type II toxin-antitoxin system VapB family antitoxin [Glycomyces amatae]MCD0446653.1 type II toxin-antitoxin system VapB family antitoxin [Glycomyces amatae]